MLVMKIDDFNKFAECLYLNKSYILQYVKGVIRDNEVKDILENLGGNNFILIRKLGKNLYIYYPYPTTSRDCLVMTYDLIFLSIIEVVTTSLNIQISNKMIFNDCSPIIKISRLVLWGYIYNDKLTILSNLVALFIKEENLRVIKELRDIIYRELGIVINPTLIESTNEFESY